jgi:hypothetical protein
MKTKIALLAAAVVSSTLFTTAAMGAITLDPERAKLVEGVVILPAPVVHQHTDSKGEQTVQIDETGNYGINENVLKNLDRFYTCYTAASLGEQVSAAFMANEDALREKTEGAQGISGMVNSFAAAAEYSQAEVELKRTVTEKIEEYNAANGTHVNAYAVVRIKKLTMDLPEGQQSQVSIVVNGQQVGPDAEAAAAAMPPTWVMSVEVIDTEVSGAMAFAAIYATGNGHDPLSLLDKAFNQMDKKYKKKDLPRDKDPAAEHTDVFGDI